MQPTSGMSLCEAGNCCAAHRNGSILLPTCYVDLRGSQKWLFKLGPKLALTAPNWLISIEKAIVASRCGRNIPEHRLQLMPIEASGRPSTSNPRRMDGQQFRVHGLCILRSDGWPIRLACTWQGARMRKWAYALKGDGSTVRHAKRLSWPQRPPDR